MPSASLLAGVLVYILAGRLIVRNLAGSSRQAAFAALNIAGLYYFFFQDHYNRFAAYLILVAFQYAALRVFSRRAGWLPWVAFFVPIIALVMIRYVPAAFARTADPSDAINPPRANFDLIGLSYLAFRCSHLVLEVRNGLVQLPGFFEYVNFCFFTPTMSVGPINPYSNFQKAFADEPPPIPVGRSALRILIGVVKFQFLGALCNQLTYSGLFQDDHPHTWTHLGTAVVFYYLYLYCNFSGFCDMAIGAAGLIGIPVAENFNNPLAARNVRDFWNRWHITLSLYMRDVVFSPLSKFLVRILGPARANHAIALAIVVVFLLVGIWHGVGWNFAAYGAVHAFGVVVNHYYTIGLKNWLGRDGFKAYNASPWIRGVAVSLTFCYCAASLLFFANTFPELEGIFASLK